MGGCFSGQKGLESENAPVPAPASPKAPEAELATAAPATEGIEVAKEEASVDASKTEEVKKDAEVVPKAAEAVAVPVEAPAAVPEEAKLAEAATAEDKTSAAPAAL